jgi:hypothetical protein
MQSASCLHGHSCQLRCLRGLASRRFLSSNAVPKPAAAHRCALRSARPYTPPMGHVEAARPRVPTWPLGDKTQAGNGSHRLLTYQTLQDRGAPPRYFRAGAENFFQIRPGPSAHIRAHRVRLRTAQLMGHRWTSSERSRNGHSVAYAGRDDARTPRLAFYWFARSSVGGCARRWRSCRDAR